MWTYLHVTIDPDLIQILQICSTYIIYNESWKLLENHSIKNLFQFWHLKTWEKINKIKSLKILDHRLYKIIILTWKVILQWLIVHLILLFLSIEIISNTPFQNIQERRLILLQSSSVRIGLMWIILDVSYNNVELLIDYFLFRKHQLGYLIKLFNLIGSMLSWGLKRLSWIINTMTTPGEDTPLLASSSKHGLADESKPRMYKKQSRLFHITAFVSLV